MRPDPIILVGFTVFVVAMLVLAIWLQAMPAEQYYRIEKKAGEWALPIGIVFLVLGLLFRKGH